jgi:hypothetical protein
LWFSAVVETAGSFSSTVSWAGSVQKCTQGRSSAGEFASEQQALTAAAGYLFVLSRIEPETKIRFLRFLQMDNSQAHMEQALVVIALSTATLVAGFSLLVASF